MHSTTIAVGYWAFGWFSEYVVIPLNIMLCWIDFVLQSLILRRSWLTPLLTVIIAVASATIPLVFISGQLETCAVRFLNATSIPLYLPSSLLVPFTPGSSSDVVTSPPNITTTLGNSTTFFQTTNVPDNATFVNYISQNYCNLSLGGVSLDPNTGASLIAWEATLPGFIGLSLFFLFQSPWWALGSSKSASSCSSL